MEDEYDALNVRAFTQSGSDTGVNENVNKLLKFGTHSVKMTLNIIVLLLITNICMVHWQMLDVKGKKDHQLPQSPDSLQMFY